MHLRARHRLRIALVVILSLLFQQLAIAAYACTTPCTPFDLVAMEGCADMGMGMAKETSTLCAKYCSPDKVVTADTVVPTVPALALPPVRLCWYRPPGTRHWRQRCQSSAPILLRIRTTAVC